MACLTFSPSCLKTSALNVSDIFIPPSSELRSILYVKKQVSFIKHIRIKLALKSFFYQQTAGMQPLHYLDHVLEGGHVFWSWTDNILQ